MGEPFAGLWTFDHHPWLREVCDDDSEEIVIQKAAQMGFTEYSLNRTLYTLDQLRRNTLYALPNQVPDAMGFSRGRINAAMELSPYIDQMFTTSRSEGHKITKDNVSLYVRGARSRICFKQIDVALVVLDELDEMSDEAIGLARYRLSGQREKQLICVSTPSVEGIGINRQYQDTTQHQFFFPCPHCSRRIQFDESCLIVTAEDLTDPRISESHLICPECQHTLDNSKSYLQQGTWVPAHPSRPIKGYHISQLYSSTVKPSDLAKQKIRGEQNVVDLIEYYNSSLGLTYTPEGAQLDDRDINDAQAVKNYRNNDLKQRAGKLITIGLDIGQKNHHLSVYGWNFDPAANSRDILIASTGTLLLFRTIQDFAQLDDLFNIWQPHSVVVDAQPDLKGSTALAKRYPGLVAICYYSGPRKSRDIREQEHIVHVNRSYWMDSLISKVKNRTIFLPRDLPLDYREHLKAPIKTYKKDDTGEVYAEFVKKQSSSDHYFHSSVYALIALGRKAGKGQNIYV